MLVLTSPSFLRSSPHSLTSKIAVNVTSPAPVSVKFQSPRFVASFTSAEKTSFPFIGSSKMASSASFYEVLGIPMGATSQEIKSAYRKLARSCHPDVVAIDRKNTSTDEFMKIHTAYSTLLDPKKRADYDQKLFNRARPFSSVSATSPDFSSASSAASMSGFSGYTRRTWETDQCW